MDVFDNLPTEKKERIINGAMKIFAIHGYRKTSVSDIANTAEISKAMVFTYFGSKRDCYEFMCNEMLRVMLEEFNNAKEQIMAVTDYFDRIILVAKTKVKILSHYPQILLFARSVFSERDEEVYPIICRMFSESYDLREMFISSGINTTKFKNSADAENVGRMTAWLSFGCADEWSRCDSNALEGILADFINCMLTLKKYFYKEEF